MNTLMIILITIVAVIGIGALAFIFKYKCPINDKIYDALCYAKNILEALSVFWLAIGEACNIECTAMVGAIIAAMIVFMEAVIKSSNKIYKMDEELPENYWGDNSDDIDDADEEEVM